MQKLNMPRPYASRQLSSQCSACSQPTVSTIASWQPKISLLIFCPALFFVLIHTSMFSREKNSFGVMQAHISLASSVFLNSHEPLKKEFNIWRLNKVYSLTSVFFNLICWEDLFNMINTGITMMVKEMIYFE